MLIPASLPHEISIETGSTTGKTFEALGALAAYELYLSRHSTL